MKIIDENYLIEDLPYRWRLGLELLKAQKRFELERSWLLPLPSVDKFHPWGELANEWIRACVENMEWFVRSVCDEDLFVVIPCRTGIPSMVIESCQVAISTELRRLENGL